MSFQSLFRIHIFLPDLNTFRCFFICYIFYYTDIFLLIKFLYMYFSAGRKLSQVIICPSSKMYSTTNNKTYKYPAQISARRKNCITIVSIHTFQVSCHNRQLCPVMAITIPKFPPGGNFVKTQLTYICAEEYNHTKFIFSFLGITYGFCCKTSLFVPYDGTRESLVGSLRARQITKPTVPKQIQFPHCTGLLKPRFRKRTR